MPARKAHACFAVATPGLEGVVHAELRALGLAPRQPEPGGVAFEASDEGLVAANLRLRAASRVLVRVAELRATAFHELERQARAVPWKDHVAPGGAVRFRVTCKKSRLYHSDAVAERLLAAVSRAVPGAHEAAPAASEDEEADAAQLFVARFVRDVCTISADASGALLHRRGYRRETAKAPLRETLGAALLLALGWDGTTPLVDPMCGSGTLPIEAALIARRLVPGRARSFACESWPSLDRAAPGAAREAARAAELARSRAPIVGSDRDAGAIAAATANATRAGVAGDVSFAERALSALEAPTGPGLVLVNPPYGDRIGDASALRNLYAQLGNVVRERCPGYTLALVSADRALEAQVRLPLREVLRFSNGGIPVRLVAATVPRGG